MRFLLAHLLASSAAAFPDRPAVVDGDLTVPYGDLEVRANRFAHLLADLGVGPGSRVGLHLEKSLDAVVAIHGVLKAGAGYVPLDHRAPTARLAAIARSCDLRTLVTGRELAAAWPELAATTPLEHLVVPDLDDGAPAPPDGARLVTATALAGRPDHAPCTEAIEQDVAYVLHTSGSTGVPKGVTLTHRNALAFVDWAVEELGLTAEDRLSSHAPFHFDLSTFDLFAAAAAGACVSLVPTRISFFPGEVARFIREQEITTWYSVPSILSMLADRGNLAVGDLPHLRTVLFAGEVFPVKYLRRLMQTLPHARFCNLYGPTETNVCTYQWVDEVPAEDGPEVAIGRPIANVRGYVVGDDGQLAPRGEAGELWVRGPTVMRCYWGDPERTGQALVPDPFDPLGDPLYRTGDIVVEGEDGAYRLLGRRDHQIKSRGYRIELGEVERVLTAHPDVVESAVVAVPDELITNRIRAVVSVRDGCTEQDLARHCRERLPRYMVPHAFAVLDELPHTSTGKIDRRALSTD